MTVQLNNSAHKRENNGANLSAKIIVVDDHPIVRHALIQLIAKADNLEVCGEACDAGAALDMITTLAPDLVIVDLSLPGPITGLELVERIVSMNGGTRILVLSMMDEATYAEQVLHLGAAGYVQKERATEELLGAIRQVLEDGIYVSAAVRDRLISRGARGARGAHQQQLEVMSDPVTTLSDREMQVFKLVGQGKTTNQIAEELMVSPKTVHTYRQHIMLKLAIDSSSQLIVRAASWVLENCKAPADTAA